MFLQQVAILAFSIPMHWLHLFEHYLSSPPDKYPIWHSILREANSMEQFCYKMCWFLLDNPDAIAILSNRWEL
jgi:hypothetical protein